MQNKSNDNRKIPQEILLGTIVILALVSCGPSAGTEPQVEQLETRPKLDHSDEIHLTAESIRRAGIRIEESKQVELVQFLEATGTVSPDESRVVRVRTLARGVIDEVYVRRGDRVGKGHPLVQIDNIELGELVGQYLSQHLQLHRVETELEVARKVWERGVELLGAQAIAKKEVELREAQHKNAQAMVDRQRAIIENTEEKLHRFGLTEQDIEKLNEEHSGGHRTASHSQLKAPFPGVIIEYNVAPGEVVDPSRELMTLADLSSVWVLANVYEKDLGIVREGQMVEVMTSAYPERVFSGKLTYVSDVLEPSTRTARVRCVVPNPENLLKLEMFATVRIPSTLRRIGVAVPAAAIQNIDGEDVVFVAGDSDHFQKVLIKTGLTTDGWIEVDGLAEGTPVVSSGSFYLKSTAKRSEIEPEHGH